MTVTVFGVRHHGPGCARSLRAALEELQPDIVLVEGPPEGDQLIPLIAEDGMEPPVALLVYRPDMPRRAAFYPFAEFSPEWQTLGYALDRSIPVRFCDLPQAVQLGVETPAEETGAEVSEEESELSHPEEQILANETEEHVREDPIGVLAAAAGHADPELWWEEEVERRADPAGLFEAILEAMSAVRDAGLSAGMPDAEREAHREAHMRQTIRAAEKEGFERIAVVCGAWHAPALHHRPPAREDAAILTGLTKIKVETTWIPWTNFRLAFHSGYGAGITSPGWYQHLWSAPDRATVGWVARAAQLLRQQRLDAPASAVIDAVRLAETLAALRERRNPGLDELREAILTTLCHGEAAPMSLIRDSLEVGEVMGSVPPVAPAVPLQRDVESQQRRLRLRPLESKQTLDLDLRKENDRARSILLHRLHLLGLEWGTPAQTTWRGRTPQRGGTFHELWRLQWQVEFPLRLIELNAWGNTVAEAAESCVRHQAASEKDLPRLTELLSEATVAELPAAVSELLQSVQAQSAATADARHLMDALLPLAGVARYGDVRGTESEEILRIVDGLFERTLIALPGACVSLDEPAAEEMVKSMAGVEESVKLLDRGTMRQEWQTLLHGLFEHGAIHPLVRGWCCRLLLDQGMLDGAELQRLAGLALSRGTPAREAASWIEGLLRGSGLLLLHEDGLWVALDGWLRELDEETFNTTLPLLRRAFSGFQPPERRAMSEKVKRLQAVEPRSHPAAGEPPAPGGESIDGRIDRERARQVIPVLAQILGGVADGDR